MQRGRSNRPLNERIARKLIEEHGITADRLWKPMTRFNCEGDQIAELFYSPRPEVLNAVATKASNLSPQAMARVISESGDLYIGFVTGGVIESEYGPMAALRQLTRAVLM